MVTEMSFYVLLFWFQNGKQSSLNSCLSFMSIPRFSSSSRTSSSILYMSLMPDASSSMLEDRYSYLSSSFSLINSTSLIASSAIIAFSPSSSDTLNSWNSCPERKGPCYGIVSNWYSRLRSSWCIWWLNSCFQWSHCSFSFFMYRLLYPCFVVI